MTADQFYALTQYRLDQLHWPENKGRGITEVTMTIKQLQTIVEALQGIKVTREGQTVPKRDQVDNKVTKERRKVPKMDQMDQENRRVTREGEMEPKADQEDQEKKETKEENNAKDGAKKEGNGGNNNQATKIVNGCNKPVIIKDKTQSGGFTGFVKGGEGGRDGDGERCTEIGEDKTLPGVNEVNGGINKTQLGGLTGFVRGGEGAGRQEQGQGGRGGD